MDSNALHTNPFHSIANAFHRNGIHTIGMDAHGVAAAGGGVAGTTWPFRWRIGGKTAARTEKTAAVRTAKWSPKVLLRTSVRRAIIPDTGLPQELAKQMREVTRQIAGLTNELESLLPRDRYIRDRPTNAPPAGCSDDDENWRSQGD